ncbi:MAG: hypothetical protein EOP51_00950 [Sphingobacteriales bacterium]|nr:MAG: hypothetical protein EOP51_00950 [Sphingobacteriales bacterium]
MSFANDLVHRFYYKLGYSYRYNKFRKIFKPDVKAEYAGKKLLTGRQGNDLIAKQLESNEPFLAARLGSVELGLIYNYYLYNGKNVEWDKGCVNNMQRNAGFFPTGNEYLIRYCEEMLKHIEQVDLMGVWYNEGEEEICQRYCKPDATFCDLVGIEPFYYPENPWSKQLAGKKVLVIHPFDESINYQYKNNRERIFAGQPDMLPEFELKTIRAVQSIGGDGHGFKTWFEAYESMCKQMQQIDFDVVIIGAGAYGMPLGSFAKQMGKQAIHMGGASQLLFGILGKRWADRSDINIYFNQYWKRPYPQETPDTAQAVENACYW